MLERMTSLGAYSYLYAAFMAFLITYIVMKVIALRQVLRKDEFKMEYKEKDRNLAMARLTKMFPIETVNFKGRIFKKGMTVRITTLQKKVFQGEFIGKNDLNVICILTNEHIIAHEMNKISEMISLDETK